MHSKHAHYLNAMYVVIAILTLFPLARAVATGCTCRPEIKSDSSLEGGTCTKTQDDGSWCEMTWNGGVRSGAITKKSLAPGASKGLGSYTASQEFLTRLEELKLQISPDVGGPVILGDGGPPASIFAASKLSRTPPEEYTVTTVRQFALLLGTAVIQFDPKRVGLAVALYANPKSVLKQIQDKTVRKVQVGDYRGLASVGCLILFDSSFRAMVKTPFSLYIGDCE